MTNDPKATESSRLILQSLSVDNLRSLQELPAIPLEGDLTILAGQNGGGKTSFIDALLLLLDNRAPSEGARSSSDREITVIGAFASSDRTESLTVRATYSNGQVQRQHLLLVHSEFGDLPGNMNIQGLRQALARSEIESPGGSAKAPFAEAANKWISQRPMEEFCETWVSLSREHAERLPELTVFRSQDAEDKPNQVRNLISQESRRLLAAEEYEPRLKALTADIQISIDPVLTHVKEMIVQYSPEIDDVEINASFDFSRTAPQVQMQLKKHGVGTIDLAEAGSGLAQRVGLAIYAATLESLRETETDRVGAILAYDEPDTHLDYGAQRDLFEIIRGQGELQNVQVVLATHSVNLIDTVSVRSLRHFRLEDRRTTVDTLPDYAGRDDSVFIGDLAAGLGIRNSMLLNEGCFLVVEGPTEQRALPILFRKLTGETLASAGITLIDTRGSGGVRRLVEALIEQLKRSVVVLVDQDVRGNPTKINEEWLTSMRLEEGINGFFTGTKEFEDAFEDEIWLHVAVEHFPLEDGTGWQLSEMADARTHERGMGHGLEILFSRRLRRTVGKPELGESLGRTVAAEDIPEVIHKAVLAILNISRHRGGRDESTHLSSN